MAEIQAPYNAAAADRAVVPVPVENNGHRAVPSKPPPMLEGVKLPTHNATVRRRVLEAYWRDRWDADSIGVRRLTVEALPLVVALFDNVQRRRKLAKALDVQERKHGVLTTEGKARQALDKLLDLDGTILRQMDALGWTPTSMARFGVDLARLRSSSKGGGGETVPLSKVEEIERRVVACIEDQHRAAQEPDSEPSGSEPTSATIEATEEGA